MGLSFHIVREGSQRKKARLIDSQGFTYNVSSRQHYATYWQCTVRQKGNYCKASVIERDGRFTPGGNAHNHTTQPGALLASQIVKEVKNKATAEKFKPASAIIEEVIAILNIVCISYLYSHFYPIIFNNILFLVCRCYLTAYPTLHVQHSQHRLAWLELLIG